MKELILTTVGKYISIKKMIETKRMQIDTTGLTTKDSRLNA